MNFWKAYKYLSICIFGGFSSQKLSINYLWFCLIVSRSNLAFFHHKPCWIHAISMCIFSTNTPFFSPSHLVSVCSPHTIFPCLEASKSVDQEFTLILVSCGCPLSHLHQHPQLLPTPSRCLHPCCKLISISALACISFIFSRFCSGIIIFVDESSWCSSPALLDLAAAFATNVAVVAVSSASSSPSVHCSCCCCSFPCSVLLGLLKVQLLPWLLVQLLRCYPLSSELQLPFSFPPLFGLVGGKLSEFQPSFNSLLMIVYVECMLSVSLGGSACWNVIFTSCFYGLS